MRKKFIRLFHFAILTTCFYACGPETVKTGTQQFNKKYYLTPDTLKGVLSVNMQVELPEKYKNTNILEIIKSDIVEKIFGSEYIQYSSEDILPRFANDMNNDYRANNLPFIKDESSEEIGYAYNNDYILETFSLLNDKHIFSYGVDLYVYMGGAHGITNRIYYNYNLANGTLITEADLFTNDYQAVLSHLLKQHIIADNATINSPEELDEIYWTEHIAPNGNFYITHETINYVFNPYEIAPYVFGNIEVNIPFTEIKEILKKDNPINYLVINN